MSKEMPSALDRAQERIAELEAKLNDANEWNEQLGEQVMADAAKRLRGRIAELEGQLSIADNRLQDLDQQLDDRPYRNGAKRIAVLEHALKLITDPCNGAMVKEDLAWKALKDKT